MRGLLWLLAVFALAAGLSVAIRQNEGYALLVYPPWQIELSLNLLAVILIAGFFLIYIVVRTATHTLRMPSYVRAFRERQRERRGRDALVQSLKDLFGGRYVRAEKYAAQCYETGPYRALSALIAARAAQRTRNFSERDAWLARARSIERDWRQPALTTQAELLLEERRYEEARSVLREMRASGPRHIVTLRALFRAEQGLENWDEVVRLARVLEKHDAMPAEALRTIVVKARVAMLSRMALDSPALSEYWRTMPSSEQHHPAIAAAAARAWIRLGERSRAHRVIEAALAAEWNADLVLLYGQSIDEDALLRIERAEDWLKEHPQDAELLLTLGKLCAQRELWGKAQSYLEASLAVRSRCDAHLALARLYDRIGRADDAARHYRASVELIPEIA